MTTLPRSTALMKRATQVLPGGVNSPVRSFRSVGGTPPFVASARGATVTDVDGRTYVDYVGSYGPALLGHAHPKVVEAVQKAAEGGLSFGAPTEGEVLWAEWVCERFPGMDQVRMVNSGTEAVMTAVRLARGVTGRDKVIKCIGGYHGHLDALLVAAGSGALTHGQPSSPGVPDSVVHDTLLFDYNDLEGVRALFEAHRGEVAALLIEPIAGNMGCVLPDDGFLEGLRALCDAHQTLLVFDEVMTGLRVHPVGAGVWAGVQPDITVLGKVVGGGMPVGAVGASHAIMSELSPVGPVYQAGTLSGNPLAVAAGLANFACLDDEGVLTSITSHTEALMATLREVAATHGVPMTVQGVGGMFGLFFHPGPVRAFGDVLASDTERFTRVFHRLLAHGVYWAPSPFEAAFTSWAHDDDTLATTRWAFDQALKLEANT